MGRAASNQAMQAAGMKLNSMPAAQDATKVKDKDMPRKMRLKMQSDKETQDYNMSTPTYEK